MAAKLDMAPLAADFLTNWLDAAWLGLIVIVVLAAVGVWLALKDRKRKAALTADAEPGHWSADCIDPLNARTPMFVVVDSKGFKLVHSRTGAALVKPWSQVRDVSIATHKMRLKNYIGLTVSLPDDESVDLLFLAGAGKDAYARGAEQAHSEFRRRLNATRIDREPPEPQ
ncbi:hypothetical protein CLV47_12819 [Antricoccus suffuscus]|uniref:PH (Pleckstrin Homology) domain-containing protein n=1 Tax=Antricoccus suffuscus TaxID=1629062 RepID=A0A2T0Z4U4_9ACTN|nr:hypothetical protein [Antricoccus suffuscus]PRZ31381.1 hypothetical protein CLV47_12819 [Antricoccus suffuscus]